MKLRRISTPVSLWFLGKIVCWIFIFKTTKTESGHCAELFEFQRCQQGFAKFAVICTMQPKLVVWFDNLLTGVYDTWKRYNVAEVLHTLCLAIWQGRLSQIYPYFEKGQAWDLFILWAWLHIHLQPINLCCYMASVFTSRTQYSWSQAFLLQKPLLLLDFECL